jgi:hypothetical protein
LKIEFISINPNFIKFFFFDIKKMDKITPPNEQNNINEINEIEDELQDEIKCYTACDEREDYQCSMICEDREPTDLNDPSNSPKLEKKK